MDTRIKIISFDDALAISQSQPVRWVTGHFDPLLAEHARRMREFVLPGHALIAVVTNPAEPLLDQRARAELVASLADVDYVVMRNGPPSDQPDDSAITQQFIAHVLSRHGARVR